MKSSREEPTVLLADDEPDILQMYELFLDETCTVVTATDGDEVLELVDDSIDVVLLDRRMPGTSGDETVVALRDRGHEIPVGMVSGVKPDSDIIELPLDDYITKPVDRDQLEEAVHTLSIRSKFDDRCREFFRLVSKKTALEAANAIDRVDPDRFQTLLDRIEAVEADLDREIEPLTASHPGGSSDSEGLRGAVLAECGTH